MADPTVDAAVLRELCDPDGGWAGTTWGQAITSLLDRIDAAADLVDRWEQEGTGRGPDDQLYGSTHLVTP